MSEEIPAEVTEEPAKATFQESLTNALEKIQGGEDDGAPEPDSASVEEVEEAPEVALETAGSEDGEAPAFTWPEHWAAERKELFAKLPDDLRSPIYDEWQQIEKGYNDKFQETADQRKQVEPLLKAIEPVQGEAAARGIAPEQLISNIVGAEHYLRSNPAEALKALAQSYGRGLAGSSQARDLVRHIARDLGVRDDDLSESDRYEDPEAQRVSALEAEISALKRYQANSQQNSIDAQITSFRDAKGSDGQLLHPHYTETEGMMAAIVRANPGVDLETAYGNAVYAVPEVRAKILAAEQQKSAAATEAERKRAVTTAKRANSLPKPKAVPVENGAPQFNTFKEALAARVAEMVE